MTLEQLILPAFGAILTGLGGFLLHRTGKALDKLDALAERIARLEGEIQTSEARWEAFYNDRPSPSGQYPIFRSNR